MCAGRRDPVVKERQVGVLVGETESSLPKPWGLMRFEYDSPLL